ncbi:EamA family transporter [Burkholderia sp. Ac-20379]|uniref:EamA family transporter n=1 Tax=Burkholderia sp. Ac-20379 TaxID=2703900 RepID=UPI00197E56B6|nr:EamA family transporter [Burkholderia sp. Ac-20379]MBN3723791.1 EamA family transporter [Burkholderia sp. Ac-20379]
MKLRDILLAVFVTAIWGLNFSVIKLGLQSVDPFILAGIRFTLSAFPAVLLIRRPQVAFRYLAAYGLIFGIGLWGIVNLGIQAGLSAGIASLVLQFSAFFTILLGAAVFKERVSRYQAAGIAIALLGLACIITITDGTAKPLGVALVIAGAIAWSTANVVIKQSGTKDVFAFLVWSSLFAPIPLFAIAWLQHGAAGYAATFSHIDGKAVFSILFQAYPTTLFGYWIWNVLLKKYPVSTVAPLSLLVPIFGMLGSVAIFGEQVGLPKVLATLFIVLGLAVGLYGKRIGARLAGRASA